MYNLFYASSFTYKCIYVKCTLCIEFTISAVCANQLHVGLLCNIYFNNNCKCF